MFAASISPSRIPAKATLAWNGLADLNPVIVKVSLRLLPDTDVMESFCTEGESDLQHIYGK